MPKRIVTPALRKIVLQEKRRAPHLGVRLLSGLLQQKHKITISKSAVNKILTSSGLKEKRGRKKSLLIYKGRTLEHCGLFLLRCLDYQVGIFDYLSQELKNYFPKLTKDLLKQLIILTSFSALINEQPQKSAQREGFLRLAGLRTLPASKLSYFQHQLSQHKPQIDLGPLRDSLILVSSLKFYFNNGYCSYFDAKMSTFWNGPCRIAEFFLPLRSATKLIQGMIESKTIIIGYTKSFGYLSPLTFDFLQAIDKGIEKIEFLDPRGRVIEQKRINLSKVSFFIGYYPEAISKGISFVARPSNFKSFFWGGVGELLCASVLTKVAQHEGKQQLMINNVLIKPAAASLPTWGLLTGNISRNKLRVASFLKKYLYLWPQAQKRFIEDMRAIEEFLVTTSKNKGYLTKMLPQKLNFKEMLDFSRVGQILSAVFKEIIWGWEPKNKAGSLVWGQDYLGVSLSKMPKQAKEAFNKGCFYLDQRRVFLF
ncbi:MAG: helix-turn-helix domain-containing protein [Candidatus Omnitrophota bacterium]